MTLLPAVPDWLAALADPERPETPAARPFALTLDDAPWTVATDGKVLVALRGEGAAPLSAEMARSFAPHEARLTDPGGVLVDGPALAAWIGPAAPGTQEPCDICEGTGRIIEHDCEDCSHRGRCEECGGTGRVDTAPPAPRPGRLGAAVVNRVLLARVWGHLAAGPVRVVVTGAESPVGLHGDGWAVLVMPLRRGEGEVEAFPWPGGEVA